MRLSYAIALSVLLAACGSALQPIGIMQQWIGQPYSKVKKGWGSKPFSQPWENGNGSIYIFADTSLIPSVNPDKVRDKITKLEYVGPTKNDSIHYLILRRFYVDSKQIIRKWEIVQSSLDSPHLKRK